MGEESSDETEETNNLGALAAMKRIQQSGALDAMKRIQQSDALDNMKRIQQSDALDNMKQIQQSSALNAAEELRKSGALNAAKQMQQDSTLNAMKQIQRSSALHAVEELQRSNALDAMRQVQQSSALNAMEELRKSGALNAVKAIQNSPALDGLNIGIARAQLIQESLESVSAMNTPVSQSALENINSFNTELLDQISDDFDSDIRSPSQEFDSQTSPGLDTHAEEQIQNPEWTYPYWRTTCTLLIEYISWRVAERTTEVELAEEEIVAISVMISISLIPIGGIGIEDTTTTLGSTAALYSVLKALTTRPATRYYRD